jgi:putative tricarboxylic transport membrane protein
VKDKVDRASGLFWLIFSAFVSYYSYKLGLGTLHQPGPGFLFFWIAIVIAILSLIVMVRSLKKRPPEEAQQPTFGKKNVTKIVLVLISLLFYALFMEWLGFLIVTLLFFIFLLGVIEKKRWLFAILVSLIVTAISYLVFETALQSQLPKGLLDFLRF